MTSAAVTVRVAETFLSLQGEGPSVGVPAHFLRLQGCSVGCRWCDSRYTWDTAGGNLCTLEQLASRLRGLGQAALLVITGGEPLESSSLPELLGWAASGWRRVEVETSGLLRPPVAAANVWWNWSPKLSGVSPKAEETWSHTDAFLGSGQFVCKVVVETEGDWAELLARTNRYRVPAGSVCVMPAGMRSEELLTRLRWLAPLCIQQGFRLTQRLHVDLWGARRGV